MSLSFPKLVAKGLALRIRPGLRDYVICDCQIESNGHFFVQRKNSNECYNAALSEILTKKRI